MRPIARHDLTPRLCRITTYGDLAFLFLSGETPAGLAPDFTRQAGEVLARLDAMLATAASSRDDLLSATIWIADIRQRDAVLAVWQDWLGEAVPTWSLIEGRLATPGKLIEIGFVARRTFPTTETIMPTIERLVPYAKPRISRIVKYGDLIFLAGVTAPQPDPDPRTQFEQVLARIDDFLAQAGSDKHHILSANVWLADIRHIEIMNAAWDAWVSQSSPPARATVGARLATPQLLIEIAITAAPAPI